LVALNYLSLDFLIHQSETIDKKSDLFISFESIIHHLIRILCQTLDVDGLDSMLHFAYLADMSEFGWVKNIILKNHQDEIKNFANKWLSGPCPDSYREMFHVFNLV